MSIILESIAELSAKKKAEAIKKYDSRILELVNGAPVDPVVDPQICQDAGKTLEDLSFDVEKRLKLIDELRISLERPMHDSKIDEANKEIARINQSQDESNKKFDEERRHWQNQKNIAVTGAQRSREAGSYVAKNSDSAEILEARDVTKVYLDESRSIPPKNDELSRKIQQLKLIVERKLDPWGGVATPEQIRQAEADLSDYEKQRVELTRRYELLQLIIPIAHENVIRVACGQEQLPYPVDYRRDVIGTAVGIYEGESSSDQIQQPDAPKTEVASDKDLEAKKIQAEQATRSAGSMPTRRAKVETATVPDLEI